MNAAGRRAEPHECEDTSLATVYSSYSIPMCHKIPTANGQYICLYSRCMCT
jgi:hypothetical protein